MAAILREALLDGPKTRAQLIEILVANGFSKEFWEGAGLWIDVIGVPPSGTWERRRADLYGLAPSGSVSEAEGVEHLVGRYLGGFGPAKINDVSLWAGVPLITLKPVIEAMGLRRFRDSEDEVLLDLPRQPIPEAGVRAPVRFMPTWDATLLVHARRTQILRRSTGAQSSTTEATLGANLPRRRRGGRKLAPRRRQRATPSLHAIAT